MPSKSMRFCNHAGCSELTKTRFCEKHQAEYDEQCAQEKVRYSKTRTSAASRGYDSDWMKARQSYLTRHPLCEQCALDSQAVPATMVHHIKAIKDGGERLNPDNFIALCNDCHEKIHGQDRFKRKV